MEGIPATACVGDGIEECVIVEERESKERVKDSGALCGNEIQREREILGYV